MPCPARWSLEPCSPLLRPSSVLGVCRAHTLARADSSNPQAFSLFARWASSRLLEFTVPSPAASSGCVSRPALPSTPSLDTPSSPRAALQSLSSSSLASQVRRVQFRLALRSPRLPGSAASPPFSRAPCPASFCSPRAARPLGARLARVFSLGFFPPVPSPAVPPVRSNCEPRTPLRSSSPRALHRPRQPRRPRLAPKASTTASRVL